MSQSVEKDEHETAQIGSNWLEISHLSYFVSLILKQWYHYIVKFSFSWNSWSLRTEEMDIEWLSCKLLIDIDQTDLHRSEPSSRTDLRDEHSHQ